MAAPVFAFRHSPARLLMAALLAFSAFATTGAAEQPTAGGGDHQSQPTSSAVDPDAPVSDQQADAATASEDVADDQESDPEQELRAVRTQLDWMLAQTGLLTRDERRAVAEQLQDLERIADWSNTWHERRAAPESQRLAAAELELRANYALAQNFRLSNEEREAGYRVGKLRTAAFNARELSAPGARMLGDFWLIQADLFDLASADISLDARQQETIRRLEQFVREHRPRVRRATEDAAPQPVDPNAADQVAADHPGADQAIEQQVVPPRDLARQIDATGEVQQSAEPVTGQSDSSDWERSILIDVKLALLRLYDQRGLSEKACVLVEQLKAMARDDGDETLLAELDRWYGYCAAIGRTFIARLPTTDEDQAWASDDHRGKVILIHFWAPWYAPSTEAFEPLRGAYERHRDRGFTILSVDMGQADEMPQVDWPVTRGPLPREQLAPLFDVRTLPRYVLIDREGVVIAVAGSLAILERLERLLAD